MYYLRAFSSQPNNATYLIPGQFDCLYQTIHNQAVSSSCPGTGGPAWQAAMGDRDDPAGCSRTDDETAGLAPSEAQGLCGWLADSACLALISHARISA
jgi:hypothetical protein